jgi:septal ring factor EnvC (AmiA/AmiB activator)
VVYAEWLRGFGLLLVLDHGGGYMTLYGHNQTLLKEVGEWVASGDVIALAGESGGAERRGLYFAIRREGRALDPVRWCGAPQDRRPG